MNLPKSVYQHKPGRWFLSLMAIAAGGMRDGVSRNTPILRKEGEAFSNGLGDEQVIERVAMV
jgi:hypothetical protein